MSRDSSPTIQEFRVRAVRVPMTEPHQTASGVITESPLVLTDVITDGGISGHSLVFTYTAAALKPNRATAERPSATYCIIPQLVIRLPGPSSRSKISAMAVRSLLVAVMLLTTIRACVKRSSTVESGDKTAPLLRITGAKLRP